jgi:predicted Zn-dependent protease
VIDRRELVRALGRREIADWVLIQRDQDIAIADEPSRLHRVERRTRWQLTVHVDVFTGRGSAHLAIDAVDGSANQIVDQAIALASAAVGPAWRSTPPAAPARVKLIDPLFADPLSAADAVVRGLHRPAEATTSVRVTASHEQVTASARSGFHAEWLASALRLDALVIAHDRGLDVSREARLASELGGDAAVAAAVADLALFASAGPPPGGPCTLVLRDDALLHGGLGVWTAFANQGDAIVERQGLTRYREHAPIAPGADQIAEPLTISSDGALDYGLRSAPLGDEGDAVRRFALVERGRGAGLGLSPREAALRKRDPNGGVRNLVVGIGTWPGTLDGATGRVIEIRRLRDLAIDPYTGDANLEIALGVEHTGGAAKPFSGGTIRLDLIAALARAKRSATRIRRGAYEGPDAVMIDRSELVA